MFKQLLIGGCVGFGLAIASIPAQAQTTPAPAAPAAPSAMPAAPASQAAPHHSPRQASPQQASPQMTSPQPTSPQANPQPGSPQGTSPQQTTEVSSTEIQQFTDALKQMRTIHDEAQTQATQAIQAQGLTPERFSQIVQSQESAQSGAPTAPGAPAAPGSSAAPGAPAAPGTSAAPGASGAQVSQAEKQKFDQALAQVTQIQHSTEQRMEQAIQNAGLDVQRFQQIFAMARQDEALKARIQQGLQN
jgi:Domain of unknown function (DUF4168)